MKQDHSTSLSLALYREIIEGCADAILVIDVDQTIRFMNKAAEVMFERSPDETLGQPLGILLPESFRRIHEQQVEQFAKSTEGPRFMGHRDTPIFGRRRSGEIFPADITILRTHDKGGLHLVAVVRDITERRQLEDRLQRAGAHGLLDGNFEPRGLRSARERGGLPVDPF